MPLLSSRMCHSATTNMFIYLLFACFCLHLLQPYARCCNVFNNNIGDMSKDMEVVEGSQLKLWCSLNNSTIQYEGRKLHVDSSMILIKHNGRRYLTTQTVNQTTVEVTVPRATANDSGTYMCQLNTSAIDHKPFICITKVTVGYKPQKVINFKCISVHFRNLTCLWTPPDNPIHTKYTLEDVISLKLRRKCGDTPTDNSCEWRADTTPTYRNSVRRFHFVLTGANRLGEEEEVFNVDHYSIIKPDVPQDLKLVNVSKTFANLSWRTPRNIEYEEDLITLLIYQIRIHQIPNRWFRHRPPAVISRPQIIEGITNTSINLYNLIPYSSYNISIRCRTIQSKGEDYWSDSASLVIHTESDVPYQAPSLTQGSFETAKTEGNRSVTLYWKPILTVYHNAPEFYYVIHYKRVAEHQTTQKSLSIDDDWNFSLNLPGNATFHTFNGMDSKSAFVFNIRGANGKGESMNYSQILVDSSDRLLNKPTDISVFLYEHGFYRLHWRRPTNILQPIYYTVFWCPSLQPRPFPCQGNIEWKKIYNESTTLSLPNTSVNYHFAVSAHTAERSSGMTWAPCIVPNDKKLDKINVVHSEVLSSSNIKVSWKLDCRAQKEIINSYNVRICSDFDSEKCKSTPTTIVISNRNSESHTLQDLKPFTKYRITVQAINEWGSSEESNPIYAKTHFAAPIHPPEGRVINKTHNSITLEWEPPNDENAIKIISNYDILQIDNDEIRRRYTHHVDHFADKLFHTVNNLKSFANYSFYIKACVNGTKESRCGPDSHPIMDRTLVSSPSMMEAPWIEALNSTYVRIRWNPPNEKNGPIDWYQLILESGSNHSKSYFNISGLQHEYFLPFNCETEELIGQKYYVKIRAINLNEQGIALHGLESKNSSANACYAIPGGPIVVGIVVGSAFGLTILVMLLYSLIRWMKKKIDAVKAIKIKLPDGLEAPQFIAENFSSDGSNKNDGFMNRSDSSPNLSEANDDSFKNRHGSGTSRESNTSKDALIEKFRSNGNVVFSRQSSNDNAHGSVSSDSLGNEAHLSCDSGAEVDTPNKMVGARLFHLDKLKNTKADNKIYLPKVLESRNSDSSDSRDSGLDISTKHYENEKIKRRHSKPSLEFKNPIYDQNIYSYYSLLANSEPSLYDVSFCDNKNMMNNLANSYKPELAKSFGNIIQNFQPNPYSKSRSNTNERAVESSEPRPATNPSLTYPYSKYGVRMAVPVRSDNSNESKKLPRNENKTTNGYVAFDAFTENYMQVMQTPTVKSDKKLSKNDWSQTSYDAEVSSTSSNGSHDRDSFGDSRDLNCQSPPAKIINCDKIQNDLKDDCFGDACSSSASTSDKAPASTSNPKCNIMSSPDLISSPAVSSTQPMLANSSKKLLKNPNGYVLHESVAPVPKTKPTVIKQMNGYVSIPGIELRNVNVPNTNHVNQITRV